MIMLKRLSLEVKASRGTASLPIVIIYLLIPLLNIADIQSNGGLSISVIADTVQKFVPVVSIWWPILVFRQYIESAGNEVLWIHRNKFDSLCIRSVLLWLAYCILLIPLFIIYQIMLHESIGLYIAVLCQALLFISITYLITLVTKSTLFPLLACFLLMIFYLILWRFPLPSMLFRDVTNLNSQFWNRFAIEIGIAFFLLGIGFLLEKKREYFYR